ncbi:MAG: NOL1/NOP2/sun family putative RNA methylase [Promethearchaeati archaeon]
MIERYLKLFDKSETIKFLDSNETSPSTWIRVNTLKINPNNLKSRLTKKGFSLKKSEWLPYAFKVQKEPLSIGSTHEYLQGYYYIQDLASILPPYFLNPKPTDLVIDMAAAPGGKATHLAQIMKNRGSMVLIDWNKKRIPSLESNIRRMGVHNSIILYMDSKNLKKLSIRPDKILLDAPCTGEGLIRQDPKRKKSKQLEDLLKMSQIQKSLLLSGLDTLKSNGLLLYSTCSIAPEENEIVVNEVLKKRKNIRIIKMKKNLGISGFNSVYGNDLNEDLKHTQRFYPHTHDTIGFFICLFKKI